MKRLVILGVIILQCQQALRADNSIKVLSLEDLLKKLAATENSANANDDSGDCTGGTVNGGIDKGSTACDSEHVCLPKNDCPAHNRVEFGAGFTAPRHIRCFNEEVCCSASCGPEFDCVPRNECGNNSVPPTLGQKEIIRRQGDFKKCLPEEICCAAKPEVQTCGNRNVIRERVAGGEISEYVEFPFVVAILNKRSNTGNFIGGGSIITPKVVLTAAHNVEKRSANTLKCRAGEWDTEMNNELYPHQDRNVEQIIFHEFYDTTALLFDIALLIVETPFEFKENVQPICLPPKLTSFDNKICIVPGWGKDSSDEQYQPVMRKVELPIVPRAKCQNDLRNTRLSNNFHLHSSFICAGGEEGKVACEGDGGSPLICPIPNTNNRYYQAGIVSWGLECGLQNVPGVYTNVADTRDWIDDKLDGMGFDKSSFIFN